MKTLVPIFALTLIMASSAAAQGHYFKLGDSSNIAHELILESNFQLITIEDSAPVTTPLAYSFDPIAKIGYYIAMETFPGNKTVEWVFFRDYNTNPSTWRLEKYTYINGLIDDTFISPLTIL